MSWLSELKNPSDLAALPESDLVTGSVGQQNSGDKAALIGNSSRIMIQGMMAVLSLGVWDYAS